MPMATFASRMDVLTGRVKSVQPAHGVEEVLIAGEPEARQEAQRRRHGIQLPKAELDVLKSDAVRYGVAFPALSAEPFGRTP